MTRNKDFIFIFIEKKMDFTKSIPSLSELYLNNWLETKTAIINAIETAEQISSNPLECSEQLISKITNEIKCLNMILERNYWSSSENETQEELNNLEKIGIKAEEISNILKNYCDSNMIQLASQLVVIANLILSLVEGQKITELVRDVRSMPRTPEEQLEISRILDEALKGES
jgi:hypothetical protein